MDFDCRYAPGDGVLIGTGPRWLLLGVRPQTALVEELWAILSSGRDVVGRAEAALMAAYGEHLPSFVAVDLSEESRQSAVRGDAHLTPGQDVTLLSVGDAAEPAWPFRGGVVAASAARIEALRPSGVTPPELGTGLIDGIPASVLAASAPDGPPASRPRFDAPEPTGPLPDLADEDWWSAPAAEHAGHGSNGGHGAQRLEERVGLTQPPDPSLVDDVPPPEEWARQAPPATPLPAGYAFADAGATVMRGSPHLQGATTDTVLGVYCPAGHITPAFVPSCRVCQQVVPPQEPQRLPRPRLGVLRLPTGEEVPLDRGVLLGRRPNPSPDTHDWPHLVHLPADSTYLSRMHLQVEVDGWLVLARDLGSRGGTWLLSNDRPPERLRANEPYVLEPGQRLDLAHTYEVAFEVGS